MATETPKLAALAAPYVLASALGAQSYDDFMVVRNRDQPHRSLLQIRLGYSYTDPEGENRATGLRPDGEADGFLYYHTKEVTQKEDWALDFYAGKDGIYLGLKDDLNYGKKAQSRLELFGRLNAFYRDGYYSGDKFLVNGQYESQDYGIRIGTSQMPSEGLLVDIAAFFKGYRFDENEQTAFRPDWVNPDNFNAFGGTITLEQNTVVTDRILGLPQSGFLLTVQGEWEKNESDRTWGSASSYLTRSSSGFWRGDGVLEWYIPNGKSGVWELLAKGGFYDSSDRLASTQAEHVQGHIWADATLGYRMAFGDTFVFKPFGQLQYSKLVDQLGIEADDEWFYGGGASMSLLLGQSLALVLDYSYVNNPSRRHISIVQDFYGEHQLFIGFDMSFGSGYRR